MNKQARAVAIEPMNDTNQQCRSDADMLQLKQQKEASIRTQLNDFAREIEQLKQLHKST